MRDVFWGFPNAGPVHASERVPLQTFPTWMDVGKSPPGRGLDFRTSPSPPPHRPPHRPRPALLLSSSVARFGRPSLLLHLRNFPYLGRRSSQFRVTAQVQGPCSDSFAVVSVLDVILPFCSPRRQVHHRYRVQEAGFCPSVDSLMYRVLQSQMSLVLVDHSRPFWFG